MTRRRLSPVPRGPLASVEIDAGRSFAESPRRRTASDRSAGGCRRPVGRGWSSATVRVITVAAGFRTRRGGARKKQMSSPYTGSIRGSLQRINARRLAYHLDRICPARCEALLYPERLQPKQRSHLGLCAIQDHLPPQKKTQTPVHQAVEGHLRRGGISDTAPSMVVGVRRLHEASAESRRVLCS